MTETVWRNWSGSVECSPRQCAYPATEDEVRAIVRDAARSRRRVRVCGSGHSFTPLCATDDVLLSLDRLAGLESASESARSATVLAGTKLHALGAPLLERGLALVNQGDIDRQSLAGAVSTGTHGTGPSLGSLATQVAAVRLVNCEGELVTVSDECDAEALPSAALSLGALGVTTAITLRVAPAYQLHEREWREPIGECLERLSERIAATRHYEFFWYPQTDLAHCKSLHPVTESETEPVDGRIDYSYRIFPSERNNRFNEMEYAVSAERGPECFAEIRMLMRRDFSDVAWPVEYRTVAADRLPLSPAFGRPTVTISIHQAADLPYAEFFAAAETVFRRYEGRPHWGKLHNLNAEQLAPLYPRWEEFQAVRRRYDPNGRFGNEHLARILGGDTVDRASAVR